MRLPLNRVDSESPAGRVIETLMRRGPRTVSELVDELNVTRTAVRQQVDRLLADGWLVRTQRRSGPGRPADVFAVSQKTRRLYGGQLELLPKLILEELIAQDGPAKAWSVLRGVSRRIARDAREKVGTGSSADRFRRLLDWLRAEGVAAEPEPSVGSLQLEVRTCPYTGLADEHREICEMERETLSDLMGQPVEHTQCMLDGHASCQFHVNLGDERGTDSNSLG